MPSLPSGSDIFRHVIVPANSISAKFLKYSFALQNDRGHQTERIVDRANGRKNSSSGEWLVLQFNPELKCVRLYTPEDT